jgi:hypothetical protein
VLTGRRNRPDTPGREWWYGKRPREIEAAAYSLIQRYETRNGPIEGCVVAPELLVEDAGCTLYYFTHGERERLHIPPDALGALFPSERAIHVLAGMQVAGREQHTVGEELAHWILHAKGSPPPGQMGFSLGEDAGPAPREAVFCRTAESSLYRGKEEPAWMSQEAGYFAACLQMPRDRFGPVAERHLRAALQSVRPGNKLLELHQRLEQVRRHVPTIRAEGWDAWRCCRELPRLFDNDVIESALDLLHTEHGGQVSKAAQRRRFVELGVAVDVADRLEGPKGEPLLPHLEFFLLTDRVVERGQVT